MARDDTARERSPETTAPDNRENDSKLLGRREYMRLAGASVAALGLGASSATADEGGPANSDDWELAFEDQFEAGSLDTDKWGIGFGWGMDTSASYERISEDNVQVENEKLQLAVTHNGGPDSVYAGSVHTKNKHYYGPGSYWEAKIRTPDRHGLLPAFWAKSNAPTPNWPPEIDFFEMLGNNPNRSSHNIHYDTSGGMSGNHASDTMAYDGIDSTTNWHVYGCAWFEDRIEMYVDGNRVGTHTNATAMESMRTGAPFYMMLNIHVGKTGEPDFSEQWGDTMEVDWVRVWEHTDGSSTSQESTQTESQTETADLPNTLSISGDGSGSTSYRFTVTDTIEKSTARDASIDDEDTIDSSDVEGIVGGGTDSYEYAGKVTEFSLDGNATVYKNGSQVEPSSLQADPSTDGALPNLVVIDGSSSPNQVTTYEFEVDGDVAKDPEHGSINAFDEIADGTVSGRVVGGKDAYRFAGEITRFETDGAAFVSVRDSVDSN
ncbi:glycoside hydrolase family 16 protein [Halorussus marinus]|uniref:glycoside hydrolase family 16 protein n=1 Tax=Halorussus marinus TaxID=2505976 RepID=UPI00106EDC9E|nr:glycoside hydrolase family 16 protein [Halorussus marinus]